MTIKKAFVELIDFLEANENKKVSTIIEEAKLMCTSKTAQTTSIKDANDNVIAIFCYYHKQWELVDEVEYGSKASSATGLNSMCKVGTSLWTKAQRTAKQENADLLTKVGSGEVAVEDIAAEQAAIEHRRTTIDETNKPAGFESEQEVLDYIANK